MSKAGKSFSGGCQCGAVQFEIDPPTRFCCHCHCRYCRAAHGAAFVTWAGVPSEHFRLQDTEGALVWYGSSQQSQRGFCSRCGTTLFYRTELLPGEIHVARALIDGPIDREPQAHIFSEQRVDWLMELHELPEVPGDSDALKKFSAVRSVDD